MSKKTSVEYVQYHGMLRFRVTESPTEEASPNQGLQITEVMKPSQFLVDGELVGFKRVGEPYFICETDKEEFVLCKYLSFSEPQACVVLTDRYGKEPKKLSVEKLKCNPLQYQTRFRTTDKKIAQIYKNEAEAIKLLSEYKE